MPTILSVTDAARNFSDAINRVVFRGERFLLLRGKREVAELRPVRRGIRLSELGAALSTVPHLMPDDATAFADDIDRARAAFAAMPLRDPWRE